MNELIRLQNIHKAYQMGPDLVQVLKGVDLSVKEGEFVAIMGASGSGKSTLLHIAGALDTPDRGSNGQGEVYFRGEALSSMARKSRHELRNRRFGFVFQFYHLLPELNVLQNVLLPSWVAATPQWIIHFLVIPSCVLFGIAIVELIWGLLNPTAFVTLLIVAILSAIPLFAVAAGIFIRDLIHYVVYSRPRKAEALALLESFGLTGRLKHRPSQLSGGERQRVAIARALINAPALLLADEPTGNLDAKTGRAILDVLLNLHKQKGQTILLVTHDPSSRGPGRPHRPPGRGANSQLGVPSRDILDPLREFARPARLPLDSSDSGFIMVPFIYRSNDLLVMLRSAGGRRSSIKPAL